LFSLQFFLRLLLVWQTRCLLFHHSFLSSPFLGITSQPCETFICSRSGFFFSWMWSRELRECSYHGFGNPRVSSLEVGGGGGRDVYKVGLWESVFFCVCVSFFPLTAVRMAYFAPGLELWASSMFIPWVWKTLGFLRWKWGGDEEGICTSLICENQDFSVFACLFFPLTAVRMA